MSLHGWLYSEDEQGNPQEIVNHARTYAYLKNVGIGGLALTAFDDDVDCPAIGRNPSRTHPGLELLLGGEFWWDARYPGQAEQSLANMGTVGTVAQAVAPTTSGNMPLRLPHDGTNYLYLPGSAGNTISCTAPSAATSYIAYDIYGNLPITGSVTGGSTFTFQDAGLWQRVDLLNASGDVVSSFVSASVVSGGAVSYTDTFSVVWAINRSTSGRKTVVVTRDVVLFGTDDYLEIANLPELNFAASDSFTILVAGRFWNTQGTNDTLVAKKSSTTDTTQGWALSNGSSTALAGQIEIGDGSVGINAVSPARTVGAITTIAGVRDTNADQIIAYSNGTAGTPTTDTTTATLTNTGPVRIGRLAGAGTEYADMELFAVAIIRRALTATEISDVSDYLLSTSDTQAWQPYDFQTPSTGDLAPWVDPFGSFLGGSSAANDALGMWVEEWTGLDGSPHTRASTSRGERPGGASYGPMSAKDRVMKINMLLFAKSEAGLRHLFRWLESTLLKACDYRSTSNMWIREICPEGLNPADGLVKLRGVALLEGPTWEEDPIPNARCLIKRVSFTLGVSDPCLYGPSDEIGSETSIRTGYSDGEAVIGDTLEPAPLTGPGYYIGGTPKSFTPSRSWMTTAPIVTITSPTTLTTDVDRVLADGTFLGSRRTYVPALSVFITGDTAKDLSPTFGESDLDPIVYNELFARIDLKPFPSGSTIIIDFAAREVLYRDRALTDELVDGWRYVADRGLFRSRWSIPTSSCGGAAYVAVRPTFKALADDPSSTSLFADGYGVAFCDEWTVTYEVVNRWGCV